MAKLIFTHAEILDSSGSAIGTGGTNIRNITVEGVEITHTPATVAVENNREINESFTGRIVIRTTDTAFKQVSGAGQTGTILSSDYVSPDGLLPTEAKLKLHGATGSHSITTPVVYIMGHEDFANGRRETVLYAQAAEISNLNSLVVS
tara:strand:- start:7409 stop:7852 length:444 start_codon:yes stop_codon:yes gene_type:complete